MDNVNNGSSVTAEVFKSEPFYFQETISQNLQNLFKLRNFLSEKIEVLASAVKMIGSKDFNIDSLTDSSNQLYNAGNAELDAIIESITSFNGLFSFEFRSNSGEDT